MHRAVVYGATAPDDVNHCCTLRQSWCQSSPHFVRCEVLSEDDSEPLSIRCSPHRERIGEAHLDPRIETLRVFYGEAAATQ
ncbi:MAG: hypothetical protein ACI9EF_003501 [Pseudohongiellaceae bacterium]|jgi:hypothetical protein